MKVVYEGAEAEIIEKKSRFIATVMPVHSEEEAVAFIDAVKKKNWNATHNCTAFAIGANNELTRCSDDGEPSGTAGKPMLEVLLGQEIHDVAVVVTRYFGGTLLGTGGLVRAYQSAVKAGLEACKIIDRLLGVEYMIKTDYNDIGKVQYVLAKEKISVKNIDYSDVVRVEVLIPQMQEKMICDEITERTCARANMTKGDVVSYGVLEGEIIRL